MSTSYRLTGRIEEGELAELYKATREPGGDGVVKLFHPRTSDPAYARDLADTAQKLGALRHPGIVQYVDVGFVKERLAVVREYVDGFTLGLSLQRLHTKEVLLPGPIALYFVIQLLEAAQRAHEAGVVHGAITPGNVLLSREGIPSLCEFGALRALMSVPQLKATFAGRGRSAYRAPEVTRGEPSTEQSDIYSLGAIAYELLTLREPVVPGGGLSTRREGLPPPSRLDRRINSRLDPVIMRALDPSAQRRFRSCGEFAGALRNFLAANGGMPGTDDLRRFASELFPNEVNLAAYGPVPFAERFQLTPVSGAEIAHLHAEELENSVVARPTFSRPAMTDEEANAETQEASPMFEEFKPPERSTAAQYPSYGEFQAPEQTQAPTRGTAQQYPPSPEETHVGSRVTAERHSPFSPEETQAPTRGAVPSPFQDPDMTQVPARGSASSMEWEAPPGAAPPKPARKPQGVPLGGEGDSVSPSRRNQRPAVPLGGEGDSVSPSRRNPRLREVVDHTASLTDETPAASAPERQLPSYVRGNAAAEAQAASRGGPHRDAASALVGAAFRSEVRGSSHAPDRSEIPMPPPTSDSVPARGRKGRRLFTEELSLRAAANKRLILAAFAAGIAIVGVLAFLTAAWQLNGPATPQGPQPQEAQQAEPAPPADPKASAVSGPLNEFLEKQKQEESRPTPPKAPTPRPKEAEVAVPKDSAFLTLRSNVPARVSIDGERLNRKLPLVRYPVKAGSRTILVESLGTNERHQFNLRFDKGQHRVLEETFTGSKGR